MSSIHTIGIAGAGTMGAGIAQVFAQSGRAVVLYDPAPAALDRARRAIERSLGKFVEKATISPADRDTTLARVHMVTALDALGDVDYVVEAIVEELDAKRGLFAAIDGLVRPGVVLSSNTSSISIAALAGATSRPDRVVGMHFMNPVPLMPLVELVRARSTADETMATASDLCRALGKTPVESADRPGFIANRILMPMINEAAYAVLERVGSVEAIDTVMKLGMSHPMGPLALADLIGIDVCVAILDVMRDGLGSDKYEACPLLRQMAAEGMLGRKAGKGFYDYQH